MARILVLTNDDRTILEEGGVGPDDFAEEPTEHNLLGRIERAVGDAEARPARRRPRVRRIAMIVPSCGYRDVRPG